MRVVTPDSGREGKFVFLGNHLKVPEFTAASNFRTCFEGIITTVSRKGADKKWD